jgi:ribA/ribD-fused uncharacterized protein
MSINGFTGEYSWLSNFQISLVNLDNCVYPTVEHAYQAAKTLNYTKRLSIRDALKPSAAMAFGRALTDVRPDWEEVKLDVMLDLLREKFSNNMYLREKLLETGDEYLEETNTHGDHFYGVCDGIGLNHLGHLIMQVRKELRG